MTAAKQHKISIEYVPEVDMYLAVCKGLPGVDATGKTRGEAATLVDAKIIEYHQRLETAEALAAAEDVGVWP